MARILVEQLLPSLMQAGKKKPLDQILGLVLKTLAKAGNDDHEAEVLGAREIVKLWILQDPFKVFEVYDS